MSYGGGDIDGGSSIRLLVIVLLIILVLTALAMGIYSQQVALLTPTPLPTW